MRSWNPLINQTNKDNCPSNCIIKYFRIDSVKRQESYFFVIEKNNSVFLLPLHFGWLLVRSLYKDDYLQIFKYLSFRLHDFCDKWEVWALLNRNHTSCMTVVTPTDPPNSIRNRCVIEGFGSVFVLSIGFRVSKNVYLLLHFIFSSFQQVVSTDVSIFLSYWNSFEIPFSKFMPIYFCNL